MPKYLQVNPHLSVGELEKRYRQAKGVTERNPYQIIWLVAQCIRHAMSPKVKPSKKLDLASLSDLAADPAPYLVDHG